MNSVTPDISTDDPADRLKAGKWPARLELGYTQKGDRTVVERRHFGPLLIQRPFYPERDGTCHNYVLHPPGGVAGGDTLELKISVGVGARCLLTAPGATKAYRTPGKGSRQSIAIDVAAGGVCEMLPMELILFDGARFRSETEVRLRGDAVFFGWDLVSLGRPAANERFTTGMLEQRVTITRDGAPLWYERAKIEGGSQLLEAAYAFAGKPIFGTALYAGPLPEGAIDKVRERVAQPADGLGSMTEMDGLVVCRFIGSKVSAGRSFFAAAWNELRRLGQGKPAVAPRIWAT